jgi:hypothetical protein
MASNGKTLTAKVVGLDDTFNLDMWKAQFEIWPRKSLLCSQSEIRTDYLPRPIWRSYLLFQGKKWIPMLEEISWHTTRTPNLHYLESGHGRYSIGKAGLQNRNVWTRLILWKPSSLISQGRSRARKGGAHPRLPKGINTTPWAPKEVWSIHLFIRELPTRRRSTRRKPTAATSPRVA